MSIELKWIIFALASIGILWISRSSLHSVHSHGFYRFFAWEAILIMFLINVNYWFVNPFSLHQIISWIFLIISLALIILGVRSLHQQGKLDGERDDLLLVGIEKTTELVMTGLYRYIRHPFYCSLLFLGWGIFFKHSSWICLILALINTTAPTITARVEEVENVHFFGDKYQGYMARTKMFVPFLI